MQYSYRIGGVESWVVLCCGYEWMPSICEHVGLDHWVVDLQGFETVTYTIHSSMTTILSAMDAAGRLCSYFAEFTD